MSLRPTLAAVAAHAGVSPSTASLAFSGSSRVAPATRERVLTAAAELGYAGPDPIAASLRRGGRSGVVGAFIGERLLYAFRDPVAITLLDGITEVLGPHGMGLLLLAGDTGRPSSEQLGRLPLDAAIFATCGLDDDPALAALRARGVPLVGVEGPAGTDVLIDIDDLGGTRDLARHLHDLGHRRVEMIAMPLRLDGSSGPVDRARRARAHYRDVRRRIEGAEAVFGSLPIHETASNSVADGAAAGHALLDVPVARRPTAILAQSDVLAAGVLRAAAELGLRVPEDVSVVGFDGADLHWLGATRLTTVVQPTAEKGRAAATAAMELVDGGTPPDVLLPVTLRIGTTSGPPSRSPEPVSDDCSTR